MATRRCTRRDVLIRVGTAVAASSIAGAGWSLADQPVMAEAEPAEGTRRVADVISRIADPDIRAGVTAAVDRNLLPAAGEKLYPGHFTISADGSAYGADSTWPGLDSWQMAGAYLLVGRTRLVLDYFDFVRAAQREDGNIPWAILPGTTRPDATWLSGLRYPEGSFTYAPPPRPDVPASALATREWVGMFGHWQPKARPLSNLAAVCYVLTAGEVFAHTRSDLWLRTRLDSVERAAKYLLSRKSAPGGLIAGSGFYTELPPRHGHDGVAQCYVVHAFRALATLLVAAGDRARAATWTAHADALARSFADTFWRDDHFAEYVHVDRGLVDAHGLSDTNWAAVAFDVATDAQLEKLWPRLTGEPAFWAGGVPTHTVARPASYEAWELHEKLPFAAPPLKDAAAMGRVWYLETLACRRVGDTKRLVESTRLVARAAIDGYWPERFHARADGDGPATRTGPERYCEYPAVLARTVLGNPAAFGA